jgi:hypothetical protein
MIQKVCKLNIMTMVGLRASRQSAWSRLPFAPLSRLSGAAAVGTTIHVDKGVSIEFGGS